MNVSDPARRCDQSSARVRASAGHYVPKASDDIGRSRYSRKNVKLGFSPGNAGKARCVSVFRC
ncbi:hypothetical protein C2U71_29830 [Burkholderia ubonensis]|nr:hypothetical protein C2U71_29830 [Burkholderia ubonensis]